MFTTSQNMSRTFSRTLRLPPGLRHLPSRLGENHLDADLLKDPTDNNRLPGVLVIYSKQCVSVCLCVSVSDNTTVCSHKVTQTRSSP